jgi:hypothetical protein
MSGSNASLVCTDRQRRKKVRLTHLWNGIDYLEVEVDPPLLRLFFLARAPEDLSEKNVVILGGRRVTGLEALRVEICRAQEDGTDDCVKVWLNRSGDFSTYTFCLVEHDEKGRPIYETDECGHRHYRYLKCFDPRYACIDFNFRDNCPSDLDCARPLACPPPDYARPEINYLAKDYASFRQLIYDRLALLIPGWQERHVPDLGVTLVELLAYTADQLSYYQDAVATEAYLDTARQRISVRRHTRLVDYVLHEGCNARAWVHVHCGVSEISLKPADFYFITPYSRSPLTPRTLSKSDLPEETELPYQVFEPLVEPEIKEITFYEAHNCIRLYTWGDTECCLLRGATSATLIDGEAVLPSEPGGDDPKQQYPARKTKGYPKAEPSDECDPGEAIVYQRKLKLQAGDFLLFEEVRGAKTGLEADADWKRRQVVRLTCVRPAVDPLDHQPLLEVEWDQADALAFPLCISSPSLPPECDLLEDVSVARGNIILVDHGRTIHAEPLGTVPLAERHADCEQGCPAPEELVPGKFPAKLDQEPLTHAQPVPGGLPPAGGLLLQDSRQALPSVRLSAAPAAPGGGAPLFKLEEITQTGFLTKLARRLFFRESDSALALWGRLPPAARASLKKWAAQGDAPPSLLINLERALVDLLQTWLPQADLLASSPSDLHFVVETDDRQVAHLRFGDGKLGRCPAAGEAFYADYRVGSGLPGNVGAETITVCVLRNQSLSGGTLEPRNPFPAQGGLAPETLAEAKLMSPHAFRTQIQRAILPEDYAALLMRHFSNVIQRSAAILRWTGSWYEVWAALDPLGGAQPGASLLADATACLNDYRRMGHDLFVDAGDDVPIDLQLSICTLPGYQKAAIKSELLDLFGSRRLPDGRLGFFHPDNLTFGQGIAASRIVALAGAVPGVESVQVDRLEQSQEGTDGELEAGFLAIGPFEIARLDNDPNAPENGRLAIMML